MSNAGKARGVKAGKRAITGGRRQADRMALTATAEFAAAGHNIDDDIDGDDFESMFPDNDEDEYDGPARVWSAGPPIKSL